MKRGSEKLLQKMCGAEGEVTEETLAEAVEQASQAEFKLVRWWWFGQPAIDRIHQVIDVQPDQLSPVVESLAKLHGRDRTISFDVFPYGIPALDGLRIQVETHINRRRG